MQNWLLWSLIAPFLWAVVTVIDTHFVHDVYEDEYDGTVVSGVFQSLPWLLVPFGIVSFTFPEIEVAGLAFLAGGMFICSFFCYFKALFVSNDGALMQILWGVSVLVVPFFAWVFIGEVLQNIHYIGITIAFVGICLFNFDGKIKQVGFSRILLPMIGAIVFLSLSMVITKKVQQPDADFWSIFLVFSLGSTIFSLVILAIGKKNPFKRAQKIATLSGKYFPIFAIAESLSIVATMTSQKAISLAPAVSFVAVIENLIPVFVMIISLSIVFVFRNTKIDVSPYRSQVSGAGIKILALGFIAIGIYTVA
ncbi:MAG: EamA family transporter [Candidatus Moranbacteria bacterium]|nr:EamA family transporter [Candidatus Moranbacteria bacterium]OIQ03496.1 MAG: hypothetical protein AUK58_01775 [Candidatus Moranbacteria bacterium CG2_30_41_165]PIP25303.1 MAG: hypothetical protein COX32_04425 [Candidatus Moranbacteria bacterium CG23_combo_of_CG06-09_8_20_14_all_41_28]PIV86587.1 MAG: hypothetical protein COW50_00710 [Candidatus Moranbacteria bacterium CG17_big_fil_post_rev_8_21_14_2_50_41_107]PJC00086.1 MAG: hypothetical protein CO075_02595 [Candidatus Moranbacteria bacterium 